MREGRQVALPVTTSFKIFRSTFQPLKQAASSLYVVVPGTATQQLSQAIDIMSLNDVAVIAVNFLVLVD